MKTLLLWMGGICLLAASFFLGNYSTSFTKPKEAITASDSILTIASSSPSLSAWSVARPLPISCANIDGDPIDGSGAYEKDCSILLSDNKHISLPDSSKIPELASFSSTGYGPQAVQVGSSIFVTAQGGGYGGPNPDGAKTGSDFVYLVDPVSTFKKFFECDDRCTEITPTEFISYTGDTTTTRVYRNDLGEDAQMHTQEIASFPVISGWHLGRICTGAPCVDGAKWITVLDTKNGVLRLDKQQGEEIITKYIPISF